MAANTGLLSAYADAAGWVPVRSSNVREVSYSADFAYLFVRFRNGGTYVYKGVEPGIYQGLLAAPSKGQYMHAAVKRNYFDVTKIA
jgi:hypothetical protein